jgi:hypothetical protein
MRLLARLVLKHMLVCHHLMLKQQEQIAECARWGQQFVASWWLEQVAAPRARPKLRVWLYSVAKASGPSTSAM